MAGGSVVGERGIRWTCTIRSDCVALLLFDELLARRPHSVRERSGGACSLSRSSLLRLHT